jgi:hypothetical protein
VIRFHHRDRPLHAILRIGHERLPAGFQGDDKGKQHAIFLGHVFEQVALQPGERLLQRQEGSGHLFTVTAHDLVEHRAQPRQLGAQRPVIPALDVFDQRLQARVGPVRLGRRRRQRRLQVRQDEVEIDSARLARGVERNLPAAAEIDVMLLKDTNGRRRGSGDLGNGRFGCNRHRQRP